MSKHRQGSGARGLFVPLALVGVLAAGGITWWAVAQGGDDSTTDAAAGTTTSQLSDDEAFASAMAAHDHSEDTSEEPTDAEDTATEEATEEATEDTAEATGTEEPATAGVPEALVACGDQVAAAQEVADAAALSAKHWKIHYTAQLKIDSGEYTFERAGKDWGETKVLGPDDVKRFDAAKKAYDKVAGACGDLDVDSLDAEYADAGASCVDRAVLLSDVVKTGAGVTKDWDDHIAQMAAKADTPADEYYEWWIEVVEEAPKEMKPYEKAVKALDDAPACDVG